MTRRAHAYKNKSRALKARFVQELMPAMDAGHIQRSKKDKVPCRVDISNLQCRMYYSMDQRRQLSKQTLTRMSIYSRHTAPGTPNSVHALHE